jgi:AmiR/NasT family two-component response regulator
VQDRGRHPVPVIAIIRFSHRCPVIALLSAKDPAYVGEAAKRGVFAYIVDGSGRAAVFSDELGRSRIK